MGTNQCRFSQNTLKNRLESGDCMISDERGSGKTNRKTGVFSMLLRFDSVGGVFFSMELTQVYRSVFYAKTGYVLSKKSHFCQKLRRLSLL